MTGIYNCKHYFRMKEILATIVISDPVSPIEQSVFVFSLTHSYFSEKYPITCKSSMNIGLWYYTF